MSRHSGKALSAIAISWGFIGVGSLLLSAIYRLSMRASSLRIEELSAYQWLILVLGFGFLGYSEGYRGFQQAFSPRVAARARYLKGHADAWTTLLAPFFLMGYFRSTTRRKIVVVGLTSGIVLLVILVRQVPPPWREIIDAGVVFGLGWGVISLSVFSVQALKSDSFPYSAEIPGYEEHPDCREPADGEDGQAFPRASEATVREDSAAGDTGGAPGGRVRDS